MRYRSFGWPWRVLYALTSRDPCIAPVELMVFFGYAGTRSSAVRFSCVVMRPPHDSSTKTRRRFLSGYFYRSLGNKSQIEEAAEVVCMRLGIIWHPQDIRTTFVVTWLTSKAHCRGRMPSVIFQSQLLPTTYSNVRNPGVYNCIFDFARGHGFWVYAARKFCKWIR